MDLDAALHAQLAHTLEHTGWTAMAGRGPLVRYDGKVRDCYIDAARGERVIVVTDRLSAFDRVIGLIPWKGQVLNQLAQHWFRATAHLAPNHVIESPDPNVCIGREVRPLAVELVMRAYLTGVTSTSIWKAYENGARTFAGHALPDGLRKNQPLPRALLTPSTKAAKGGHDVTVSKDELLAMGQVTADEFERAAAIAERLFAFGQARAAERGLILADTKYELGVTAEGEVIVIDEIHTPDSSRYWIAEGSAERHARGEPQRMLDKENLREWLMNERGFSGHGTPPALDDDIRVRLAVFYAELYARLLGRPFVPTVGPVLPRVEAAVAALRT